MADDTEIKIQLEGSVNDEGHVRFSDFVAEMQALQDSLVQVDKFVTGKRKQSTAYRVVALSHNSPASLTFEAFPSDTQGDDWSKEVLKTFVGIWGAVDRKHGD